MRTSRALVWSSLILALIALAIPALAEEAGPVRYARTEAPPGLGLDPSELQIGDLVLPAELAPPPSAGAGDDFNFYFHGFFRVPLRMGFNKEEGEDADRGTRVHLPPHVPDSAYTDWRYTNDAGGPWTELVLSYANRHVAANVGIAAYDLTDGSYRNLSAQLGINQAYVTLSYPDLFGVYGGVVANVGVFSNRYGAAGRYSGGKYETYLFGATHVAGENVRAFIDVTDKWTLHLEEGFGGKLEVAPFVTGPVAEAPYLTYPGPEEQGDTLLAHAHAGVSYDDKLIIGGHYLTTWTQDALAGEHDARIHVVGGDIKLIDAFVGDAYVGFSHIRTRQLGRLAGALEALHSFEGWNWIENYYGEGHEGTGIINSLLFQYSFSLARAIWHPKEFWGQGPDLIIAPFVMANFISPDPDDDTFTGARTRLKLGGEATYTPLSWLGISARYDVVQPDMDDNTRSFHVISPKIILRSEFVSHEQIVLSYSRYIYGSNVEPVWPYSEEGLRPDKDVVMISAVMWW